MELKRGIIISIQGYQRGTTNELASEAVKAGAVALRTDKPVRLSEGIESVPVIGLHKLHVKHPVAEPYITPNLELLEMVAAWADLVAVDMRNCNLRRAELAGWLKEHKKPMVADIACMADWHALQAGHVEYAYVATTMSVFHKNHRPDLALVAALYAAGEKRVIAEGNYSARADVRQALKTGARAVCLGASVANVYKLTRKYTTIDF